MHNVGVIQALEQIGAFMRDFAGATRSYYEGLVASGFTAEEAMHLTAEWQTVAMVELMARPEPDDD